MSEEEATPIPVESPINKACELLGGPSAAARKLGVKAPTVSQWRSGKRPIPADRCPEIERATAGAVTCEQLRPDVDWAYLRGSASNVRRETPAIADGADAAGTAASDEPAAEAGA